MEDSDPEVVLDASTGSEGTDSTGQGLAVTREAKAKIPDVEGDPDLDLLEETETETDVGNAKKLDIGKMNVPTTMAHPMDATPRTSQLLRTTTTMPTS